MCKFKPFSQISNTHFSSNLKSLKVKSQIKSQIFHKNEYVNRFSVESQDTDMWCITLQA